MSHTPWSWRWIKYRDASAEIGYIEDNTGVIVAERCEKVPGRLIAAAPDQNEALKVGRTVMKDALDDIRSLLGANSIIWQRMENALRVMNEAIAKAEPLAREAGKEGER